MAIDSQDLPDDTTPTDQQQQAPPGQQPPLTLDHALQELRATRAEAAKSRHKNRELTQRLSALDADGSGRISLAKHEETIRSLKLDNHLLAASHRHGIENVRRLKFELTESGALKDFDPDDGAAAADLDSLVEEMTVNDPTLRGRPGINPHAPPTTGAHFPGQPPPPRQLSRSDLAHMSGDEINAARERGLLSQLLERGY